jgi:hypothetical protein
MHKGHQLRATGRPPQEKAPGRPQLSQVQLPFDLLPHLEGTWIASGFGLKNRMPQKHTIIELSKSDMADLLALLKGLEIELKTRCQQWRRQASKSPIPIHRRVGVEESLDRIGLAVRHIEADFGDT